MQIVATARSIFFLLMLAIVLPLACALGFSVTYLMLVFTALSVPFVWPELKSRYKHIDIAGLIFVTAFFILAALFAMTAHEPKDTLFSLNFILFLTYPLLASIFEPKASPLSMELFAGLCLAGSALGMAIAIFDVTVLHYPRAGTGITDPIRLGNTALILGFLAVTGWLQRSDTRRWLYLAGPVLGLATALLAGARGGIIAFPALMIAAVFILSPRKQIALICASGLIALSLAALALAGALGADRLGSIFEVAGDIFSGRNIGDESVSIRVELYRAGWEAFKQAPLFGHGWAHVMTDTHQFMTRYVEYARTLPHLHNEVIQFAVAGGIVGVGVLVLLWVLPIAAAVKSPRDSQYRARLAGCILLVTAYIAMGIPDTMVGFELHTTLYVGLTAILLNFCRDKPADIQRS